MKCVETFLRIESPLLDDAAPEADTAWLQQRGIEPEAVIVVKLVRERVVPLVRSLALNRFTLLVHGAQSGVPTDAKDRSAYLHLRLFPETCSTAKEILKRIKSPWTMTRTVELSSDMAGVNTSQLDIEDAWQQLVEQSRWFVNFVAKHDASVSDSQVVKHLRQFLHFFANMAQMRVA